MLIDSNIIIYATKPQYANLRNFIVQHTPAVSAISYVEVLGYHRLTTAERIDLEDFFSVAPILSLSDKILDQAVYLRQQRKMSLGDSLVAATALVHQMTLVTHNTTDFAWVNNLSILDPLAGIP